MLPFKDTSAHKLEQPLAEGLAEQVIGALTAHGQVRVLARATSFQFDSPDALQPLAEQRFVTHVLGGELSRSAQRVSLSLHLHGLPRLRLVWQEALEVELADLSRIEVGRVREFGAVLLGLALWRRLGRHEFLESFIELGR